MAKALRSKVLLVVLDGWGMRTQTEANAIALARTPVVDTFFRDYPSCLLQASGLAVGLPEGQMGNSEVGHTNIGAGRVVYQDLVRIDRACADGGLGQVEPLARAFALAREQGAALHLVGLCSNGRVHSSIEHLRHLLRAARDAGAAKVFVHAVLDGRDTPPRSAAGFIRELTEFMEKERVGKIATVAGRFYAMDRDERWERVERAYEAIVEGRGLTANSAVEAMESAYARGESDEFVQPTVLIEGGEPIGRLRAGDALVHFNFRADRARELMRALALPQFEAFRREGWGAPGTAVCMTEYDKRFGLPVAFAPEEPRQIFAELLSEQGMRQYRAAETEKYAHVTFFFNGGREVLFPLEDRKLVPSPRDVKTYDLRPEMSARPLTRALCEKLEEGTHEFYLVNFANPDMVGHTGVLPAAIRAVEVIDECLGELHHQARRSGVAMVVTADHGNCELMVDPKTGEPHTAHTLNPVPLHLLSEAHRGLRLRDGILADVAPTLCSLMGLAVPAAMSGATLLPP